MGESKRRKEALGDKYGQEPYLFPWLPITKAQSQQFINWTTKGAWIGIGLLVTWWVAIRFVGPTLGLWQID